VILCSNTASAAKKEEKQKCKSDKETSILGGVVDRKPSEIVLDEMVLV
jgi:hypothetical protein